MWTLTVSVGENPYFEHKEVLVTLLASLELFRYVRVRVRVMVFNGTFNNITVILWWSVLLVEETAENHRPVANH